MVSEYRCETCTNDCPKNVNSKSAERYYVSIDCGLCCHSAFRSEQERVLDAVAEVINSRISELREQKRQKTSINGTCFVLQDIEATECDLILLNIRNALRNKPQEREQ